MNHYSPVLKNNILFCALMFMTLAIVGCGNNASPEPPAGEPQATTDPADTLYKYVLKQHDVAMAKMGTLKRYRNQADQKIDSLKKAKKETAPMTALTTELKAAEDNMNTWMHEFSLDSAQDGESSKRITYLSAEKEKVSKVREEIFTVLAKADSLLKK